jgi:undecaprenyl-diphosphatase
MIAIDKTLFLWINGLAGHLPVVDWILRGLANDYFIIVGSCLVLLALWYWGAGMHQREKNQKSVIVAALSLGITQGFVRLCNILIFRPRPFTELPTNLLFYQPTDSSFPSNSAAIVFAIAISIIIFNRKVGAILLLFAFLYGFSRVYVGVHYPLDILGAIIAGALAAFLVSISLKLTDPFISYVLKLARKLYIA